MAELTKIISFGFDKNGEADYALYLGHLEALNHAQIDELRAMLCVGIGQIERAWVEHQMAKPENRACKAEGQAEQSEAAPQ